MISPFPENVFFEALDYPEFARPAFLIKRQQESGWDKGTFLNYLITLYYDYETIFSIHYSSARRRNPKLTKEETTIPLNQFIKDADEKPISFKQVQEVYLASIAAFEIRKPEKLYSKEEVLSLVEYALWFIRKEFKYQVKELDDFGFRPRTETYFVYEVVQDGPFFNFPVFKKTVRELLISTPNLIALKHLLQKYYDAAVEIVSIWNNKLSVLEKTANANKAATPEIVKVEFKGKELKNSWWNDVPEFTIKNKDLFLNQDFASYAAQIANLLASEVLNHEEISLNPKKNFIADFCKGIHNLLYVGEKADCIRELTEGKKNESAFRYFFFTWFTAKDYLVDAEPQKGNGRIDLKVRENEIVTRIIEFKGWWNRDKINVIRQTCSYLTTFEGEGYIFVINDTKTNIDDKYQAYVTDKSTGYIDGTWEKLQFQETSFFYYRSKHSIGAHEKYIYHFIFSPF